MTILLGYTVKFKLKLSSEQSEKVVYVHILDADIIGSSQGKAHLVLNDVASHRKESYSHKLIATDHRILRGETDDSFHKGERQRSFVYDLDLISHSLTLLGTCVVTLGVYLDTCSCNSNVNY